MRPIDADILCPDCLTKQGKLAISQSQIAEAPTVESPTGEWIDEGQYAEGHSEHFYRCSECGGHIIELRVDDFCKHCGADMRGEDK